MINASVMRINLDAAKSQIHLPNFAGAQGWYIDRAGGVGGRSIQMRKSDRSAEIVISRQQERWIYFRRDNSSWGSIIDFCKSELGLSWPDTLAALSEAMNHPPMAAHYLPFPTVSRRITTAPVDARAGESYQSYLESRKIENLTIEKFATWLAAGPSGAVQFAHTGADGDGHEYRGPYCKGFSPGGRKGFWLARPDDSRTLVICESGIDCLSHAQAHGLPESAAYASTAGGCSPKVIAALIAVAEKMSDGIIIATDDDEGGDRLAGRIATAADAAGIPWMRDRPPKNDWNDSLTAPLTPSI